MTQRIDTTLADLISAFYDEFLDHYGDEDLAAVATAATINDLLMADEPKQVVDEAA